MASITTSRSIANKKAVKHEELALQSARKTDLNGSFSLTVVNPFFFLVMLRDNLFLLEIFTASEVFFFCFRFDSIKTSIDKPEFKYYGPKETQDRVIALYDYKAQRSDELDLKKGDEIFVLIKDSPNWWMGEMVYTRKQGYFPATYVQTHAGASRLDYTDSSITNNARLLFV